MFFVFLFIVKWIMLYTFLLIRIQVQYTIKSLDGRYFIRRSFCFFPDMFTRNLRSHVGVDF